MYGLWHPLRQGVTPEPQSKVRLTVLMRQQLQRWVKFFHHTSGVSALRCLPKQISGLHESSTGSDVVFTATSDAATDGTEAGLGGYMHGLWWSYKCTAKEAKIPIAILEFIAALVTFFTFAPLLGDTASKHYLHLRIDALSSPQVLAEDKAHADTMQELHLLASSTELWPHWAARLIVSHLHGIGNEFSDAASRADFDRLHRLTAQVKASAKQQEPAVVLSAFIVVAVRHQALEKQRLNTPTNKRHLSLEEQGLAVSQAQNPDSASFDTLSANKRPLNLEEQGLAVSQAQNPDSASFVKGKRRQLSLGICGILLQTHLGRTHQVKPQRSKHRALRLEPHKHQQSPQRALSVCSALLAQGFVKECRKRHTKSPNSKINTLELMHAKNVAVAPRQQTKPASPTKVHATTLVHQPVIKPPAPFVARRVHSHYSPQAKDLTNMRQRLNEVRFNGRNRKTVGLESGHWKKWVKFCLETGISEWRDDLEANSGRDQVGYQEEIDICSAFVVTVLAGMKEGGRGRPAPLPSSAMNVLRGVRRIHKSQTPKIHMVPVAEVSDTLLGLVESYKQQHGYKMLLPRRKEPWRRPWVVRISKLRHSRHLTLAGRRVDASLFWCSWFAMWDVLCQTGFRKAEVSVPSSGCFNPQEHLTRASLMWRIKGVEVADPPSSLLKSAGEGDCAILIPACSKTDRFGVIWGNKPIYLPIRFNADYCAALSLMKLELRFPAHNKDRLLLPLFQSMPGQPFTCHQLTIRFD